MKISLKLVKLVINDKNNKMGCLNSTSHTNSVQLPRKPNDRANDPNATVPFNKNLSMIPSQRAFQPDLNYMQTRKKRVAEFAMHFRIQSVMNIINQSIPFESVTELDLSNFLFIKKSVASHKLTTWKCFPILKALTSVLIT